MKSIILIITMICLGVATYSQHTVNRFNDKNNDRIPYMNMKLTYTSVTDKTGNDSINIAPLQFDNYFGVTMTDSITFGKPTNTNSWVGDVITIVAKGSSGNIVKFNGYKFKASPSATTKTDTSGNQRFTLSTKGYFVIKFVFDGTYWVQEFSQVL